MQQKVEAQFIQQINACLRKKHDRRRYISSQILYWTTALFSLTALVRYLS